MKAHSVGLVPAISFSPLQCVMHYFLVVRSKILESGKDQLTGRLLVCFLSFVLRG